MTKRKKPSFVEWYKFWEENIRGSPTEEPNITLEEWEKMAFIKKNRSSGETPT